MIKYDDASWHFGGDFLKTSPQEYGGTHIALFLRWCFTKGWAGDIHTKEDVEKEKVEQVIKGDFPATQFLFDYSDGKLTE